MKAVVFDGTSLKLDYDYPKPKPLPGEALIRMTMAGICNTDLEIMKGYAGFTGVLGHEFVGVVEAVCDGGNSLVGKRVVGEINIGCGKCTFCLKGLERHCQQRRVSGIHGKDGCFAEYMTMPVENLKIVPDTVLDNRAVFTEPLAAALEILEQYHIKPDDKVAVLGDGKLGLLIAFVMKEICAEVVLIGKHQKKLDIAFQQGVETSFLEACEMAPQFDVVVEATGTSNGLDTALKIVVPRGVIVLKSTVADRKEMDLSTVVVNEITILGSRCGLFGPAVRFLEKGGDPAPLISAVFPFDHALDAFEKAKERGALKVLLKFC